MAGDIQALINQTVEEFDYQPPTNEATKAASSSKQDLTDWLSSLRQRSNKQPDRTYQPLLPAFCGLETGSSVKPFLFEILPTEITRSTLDSFPNKQVVHCAPETARILRHFIYRYDQWLSHPHNYNADEALTHAEIMRIYDLIAAKLGIASTRTHEGVVSTAEADASVSLENYVAKLGKPPSDVLEQMLLDCAFESSETRGTLTLPELTTTTASTAGDPCNPTSCDTEDSVLKDDELDNFMNFVQQIGNCSNFDDISSDILSKAAAGKLEDDDVLAMLEKLDLSKSEGETDDDPEKACRQM